MATPHHYPIADLAYIFPEMDEASFSDLVESISQVGLLDPITIWRGKIIDGRHRYWACLVAGVEPRFEHLPDDADPMAFILAKNVARRHLSPSLKAVTAYKVSTLPLRAATGMDGDTGAILHMGITQRQAADLLGVSLRSLHHARAVLAPESTAVPELRRAVEVGAVTVSDAARVAGEPADVQNAALDRVVNGSSKTLVAAVRRVVAEAAARESGIPESRSGDALAHPPAFHHRAVADLGNFVEESGVDLIITHLPTGQEKLALYSDLADFALHALKVTGALVVVADGILLPRIMKCLERPGLHWVCELDCVVDWPQAVRHSLHRMTMYRRPILVYGKPGFRLSGSDVVRVPSPGAPGGDADLLKGIDAAMLQVVKRFIQAGQVVCDPCLMGRGGTALGSLTGGCRFIGADSSKWAIENTKKILAQAGYAGGHQHDALPELP